MEHINVAEDTEIVHVGCDLYAPSRVELTLTDVDSIKADVLAVMVLEGRRYVVQELRLTRRDGGLPITSELIRGVPVYALVRGAVSDAVQLRIPGPWGTTALKEGQFAFVNEVRHRLVEAGPTDETLLWVARIYIMGELAGEPPAKHVMEAFGVPPSTAGYWIRRAKDRKILNG
jgi:hypothetical protein